MKHVKRVSKAPRCAQSLSAGSIMTVIGQLLTVFASYLTTKQASTAA